MSIQAHEIQAIVLAGGQGSRMGGQDKGLLLIDGQALAQRVSQRIAPSVASVSIVANRNLEAYAALGYAVLSDDSALRAGSYQGPLAGVLTALRSCTAAYLAVVPCDVPNVPLDLIPRLAAALNESSAQVSMPLVAQADGTPWPDPVFMLIRRSALPILDQYYANGGRKIITWAGSAGLALAPFTQPNDTHAFQDIDTPENYLQNHTS